MGRIRCITEGRRPSQRGITVFRYITSFLRFRYAAERPEHICLPLPRLYQIRLHPDRIIVCIQGTLGLLDFGEKEPLSVENVCPSLVTAYHLGDCTECLLVTPQKMERFSSPVPSILIHGLVTDSPFES